MKNDFQNLAQILEQYISQNRSSLSNDDLALLEKTVTIIKNESNHKEKKQKVNNLIKDFLKSFLKYELFDFFKDNL